MDAGSYRTEYWQGREVMPGDQMRFVNHHRIPKPIRMAVPKIGGDLLPLFDRDKSGKLVKPRPYRAGQEDNSIAARLTGGDRRAEGKLRDELLKLTRRRRPSRARVRAS